MTAQRLALREPHGRPGSVLRPLARGTPFPAARAWIQAVLGQLYIAITIAALVGIHIARGRD